MKERGDDHPLLLSKSVLFFVSILIHNLVSMFFLILPLKSRLRFGLRNSLWIGTGYAFLTTIIYYYRADFFTIVTILNTESTTFLISFTMINIIMCWILITGNPLELLFLIFVLLNIKGNSIVLANILNDAGVIPRLFPRDISIYVSSINAALFSFPFLWYLLIKLFKKMIDNKIPYQYWRRLPVLPLLFYAYVYVSGYGGIGSGGRYTVRDVAILLCINITAYAVYVLSLQTLIQTYERRKSEENAEIMQKQVEMQRKQYYNLIDRISEGKRQNHDWRHHVLTIKGLAASRNSQALERYIDTFRETYLVEEMRNCENPILGMILDHYMKQAELAGCTVSAKIEIPRQLPIGDSDLCIIFSNLGENALEAINRQQQGHKSFAIVAEIREDQFFILFENSFDTPIHVQGEVYYSHKYEGVGIGIPSVRNLVEHAGGICVIQREEQRFRVSILIDMVAVKTEGEE